MSNKAINWSGVFPAVSTQFRSDFSLDLDATHAVIKNLVKDGVSGLVVCGTVGENTSLDHAGETGGDRGGERRRTSKIPVIAGLRIHHRLCTEIWRAKRKKPVSTV
ncbi:Probable 2-keto-3-deoxy-galactonate aldolase YagE [Serratia fonticola]|uniref:Probable 2-keto-3-deoxy-galactonate aldolase YagE n=1 Tax=Serratia fonticola TaxID=47917 RepID=A0A4U9TUK7_SERFO|nr:Probable 2-keto-3-deoxy-galactonate aldolase YagE [Serratia fonticola]